MKVKYSFQILLFFVFSVATFSLGHKILVNNVLKAESTSALKVAYEPIVEVYNLAGERQDDFAPGETAVLRGTGWTQDLFVDVHLHEVPEHAHDHDYHGTVVDASGNWEIHYPIEERHLGVTFNVEVHGLQSEYTATTVFTDSHRIDSIVPNSGTDEGGTVVTIFGAGFTGNTSTYLVTFGGTAASITSRNANQITVYTPPHTAGLVNVVVKIGTHEAAKTNAYTYTASCTQPTVTTVNSCIGGGNVTFSQTGGNTGGKWTVTGGGSINEDSGLFTPTTAGCFTATYKSTPTGNCTNTKSFVVFPSAPSAPTVNAGCGAIIVTPPTSVTGFNIEYSFNDGVNWGANNPPTADKCDGYNIKTRYTLASACGSTAAGAVSSNSACAASPATTRVVDDTDPTFTAPADLEIFTDANCAYDAGIGVTGDVTDEADNCDNSLDATFSDATVDGLCEGSKIITRTWSLTDDCGNTTTHDQIITVSDDTDPTFTAPADLEIFTDANCAYDAGIGVTGDVTDEADNCDNSLDATFSDATVDGLCEGSKIITRTWSLTDDCGNTTTHDQIITVSDDTDPTFTAPADLEIFTDANCAYDAGIGVTGDVTDEADNCDNSLDATFSDATVDGLCEGSKIITRTWSLTDDCGNTTTHDQIITVSDDTDPTFTAPADLEIFTDANCAYDAGIGVTGDVTDEADNCDNSLDATFSDATVDGLCEGSKIITRTWSLTDDCGNTTTHDQIITVSDDTDPTFTAPADLEIFTDANCAYDAGIGVTGDVTDEADNCDNSLDATFSDATVDGLCEGSKIITRTWSLTDDCGNTTTHDQIITVSDDTDPTFTAPADLEIFTDANCAYDAGIGVTGDVTDEADNCDNSLDATFSDATVDGLCEGSKIITRTWSLTDDCGNTTTHDQIITVSDDTDPTFTAPADLEIFTDANCAYDAGIGVTGDVTDEADNCDNSLDATFSDATVDGLCEGSKIITRTWSLTDDCGNTTTHDQIITVSDDTDPTFTAPADLEIFTDANCAYDAGIGVTGDVTDEADNCDNSLDATFSDATVDGLCEGSKIITRTWSLTDDCGNTTTHDQIITVSDDTDPTFTAPADLEIFTDANCAYDAGIGVTGDVTDEADNCDNSLDATFSDATVDGLCEGSKIITRTWSLTDDCGNTTTHDQIITVSDDTDPTFTAPADLEIFTDANCAYDAGIGVTGDVTDEADNCDNSLDATFSDATVDGLCEGSKIITRTWSLTDDCGNTTTHDQIITVSDDTDPTFTAPADLEIFTDANCAYDAGIGVTGDVTDEADNCDNSLDATFSDATVDGLCEGSKIITRTWSLTDDCGNTTTHDQIITVSDDTDPTFTAPADLEIFTDANCAYDAGIGVTGDVTDEADNCDNSLDATFSDATVDGLCEGSKIITRTWSLTDDCGNTTTHDQIITVSDDTDPTFTAPADLEIFTDANCAYDAGIGVTGDVTDEADNCDNSLDATFSDATVDGLCEGSKIITRTWSLTDDCGNTTTHDQIITVSDTTATNLSAIQPINPQPINTSFTLQAPSTGDNCSASTVTWYFSSNGTFDNPATVADFTIAGSLSGGYAQGTFTSNDFISVSSPNGTGVYSVKLVVKDACGNESIKTYDFLVIYDPNGGFVTGGGWIYSEPEYLIDNPNAYKGKANFGFVAKYKTGRNNLNEVDGNTNFQFKEGNFHFKSSSHEDMSLVISGLKKATYRGIGTINNGTTKHYFVVTVIDGDAGGDGVDRFRIVIYGPGTTSPSGQPMYDNELSQPLNADATTAIGGGSIVIHKPTGKNKSGARIAPEGEVISDEFKLISWPNPSKDVFNIKLKSPDLSTHVEVNVFDLSNKLVHSVKISANTEYSFGENLDSGIYIVKISQAQNNKSVKLVKY